MMENTIIIGIDPGKDGAIAVYFDDGKITYDKSPVIGKEIDIHEYVEILKTVVEWCNKYDRKIMAFVEDVHALYGSSASSTFNFGGSVYMARTALIALGIPFVLIKPKQWQAKCWQGVKLQKKVEKGKAKTDTKATSLLAAKRLFPEEGFLATERSRVPHDGIVDACLLAYYGRNFYKE